MNTMCGILVSTVGDSRSPALPLDFCNFVFIPNFTLNAQRETNRFS
jgi:hypothetical protein